MKKLLILLLLPLTVTCREEFEYVNPAVLNAKLGMNSEVNTWEDLSWFIKELPPEHQVPTSVKRGEEHADGTFDVVLQYEFEDDSICKEKIVLKVKEKKGNLVILEMKQNWKCCEDRGHTDWGTEPCE